MYFKKFHVQKAMDINSNKIDNITWYLNTCTTVFTFKNAMAHVQKTWYYHGTLLFKTPFSFTTVLHITLVKGT